MPEPRFKVLRHLRLDATAICAQGKNPGAKVKVMLAETPPNPDPAPAPAPVKSTTAPSDAERIKVLEAAVLASAARERQREAAERAPVIKAVATASGIEEARISAFVEKVVGIDGALGAEALSILQSLTKQVEKAIPMTAAGHSGDQPYDSDLPPTAAARVRKHVAAGLSQEQAVVKAAEDAAAEARSGSAAAGVDYISLTRIQTRI